MAWAIPINFSFGYLKLFPCWEQRSAGALWIVFLKTWLRCVMPVQLCSFIAMSLMFPEPPPLSFPIPMTHFAKGPKAKGHLRRVESFARACKMGLRIIGTRKWALTCRFFPHACFDFVSHNNPRLQFTKRQNELFWRLC